MYMTPWQFQTILVFFVYGLAFFSMGLAMLLESGRSPLLAEGRILRPLAIFGFLHGSHEWLELAIQVAVWGGQTIPGYAGAARLALLVLSFTSLFVFGLRIFRPLHQFSRQDLYRCTVLVAVYLAMLLFAGLRFAVSAGEWEAYADALARYLLAIPAAWIAGLALQRQSLLAEAEKRIGLALRLRWTAWCFGLYSLTQIFVSPLQIFPANLLNNRLFLEWTGIPIQVIRAGLAVFATLFLIQAIQLAEEERSRQVAAIQQSRLEALEQVRKDLVEREAMRRELLRHTVLAQEEERSRIARELHDETAQELTAFSLTLAALRDSAPENQRVGELAGKLQSLCRKMSQGLYRLVHDLRPAQLDDLGLPAALSYLCDEAQERLGVAVSLEFSGPRRRIEPLVETVFYRVAQEALTNVARHAHTGSAAMSLSFEPRAVRLCIQDAGAGFDTNGTHLPPHGWGLAGMRERAESIGALFSIHSVVGGGTTVEMIAPLTEQELAA